jgi:exodeoxyribonuclease VII small subunit
MTTDQPPAYADAIAELEAIVATLEDSDVDVDVLAGRVARAAELITLCRDRIAKTRIEVERVVADLEPDQ